MKKLFLAFVFFLTTYTVIAQDLYTASRENDIALIEQLITKGADVNQANDRGFTPLILAVYNDNKEAVLSLLKNGANPNAQDKSGNNALMGAAFKGYQEMVDVLLAH